LQRSQPLAARAQQPAHGLITSARIAFLGAESRSTNQHFLDAFRQGMREHGYVDGQNVTFVERWAEGRSERFPELIEELLSLKANVILAVSVPAALAAKATTTTIPIVFIASDPLGSGLVRSLARPAGASARTARVATASILLHHGRHRAARTSVPSKPRAARGSLAQLFEKVVSKRGARDGRQTSRLTAPGAACSYRGRGRG